MDTGEVHVYKEKKYIIFFLNYNGSCWDTFQLKGVPITPSKLNYIVFLPTLSVYVSHLSSKIKGHDRHGHLLHKWTLHSTNSTLYFFKSNIFTKSNSLPRFKIEFIKIKYLYQNYFLKIEFNLQCSFSPKLILNHIFRFILSM